jgi:hypothetical protein
MNVLYDALMNGDIVNGERRPPTATSLRAGRVIAELWQLSQLDRHMAQTLQEQNTGLFDEISILQQTLKDKNGTIRNVSGAFEGGSSVRSPSEHGGGGDVGGWNDFTTGGYFDCEKIPY